MSVGNARNRIETELFNRVGIRKTIDSRGSQPRLSGVPLGEPLSGSESIPVRVVDLAQRVRNDWPWTVNDKQQWSGSHVKSK